MKRIFTSVALILSAMASMAQQDPQFSQNMWNRLPVNPGYAGSNGTLCGTLLGRQQWGGFLSSDVGGTEPKTALVSVDAPVAALHGGIGGTVISDQIGFDKTMFVKLSYAYRMTLGPGTLGLGLEAGIINKSISGNWITPSGEPATNDGSIPQNTSDLAPDFAFGAYYHTPELYVGLSTDHLTAADLKKNNFQLARHYYITAGYNKMVGADLELRPSVFVKTDAASTQLDVNLIGMYRNMVWAGLSYRVADAIVPMVGYQQTLKSGSSFRIGYSYDLTTSAIKTNTHEIMLGYCHKLAPKAKIQKKKTVRFL